MVFGDPEAEILKFCKSNATLSFRVVVLAADNNYSVSFTEQFMVAVLACNCGSA